MNILIAEDDDQNQAMLKLILTRRGHRVKSAWDGKQAFEAVKSEKFDVVLMDVQMPGVDGLEATRLIRDWEQGSQHVPIVILTGSVPPQITEKYKEIGADTYLSKPFDIKRLDLLIELISSQTQESVQSGPHYDMQTPLDTFAVIDREDALERFGGDEEMFRSSLVEFVRGLTNRFERLSEAMSSQDWENASILAHNLKGVSANFGAQRLSQMAFRLDEYSQGGQAAEARQVFEAMRQHLPELDEVSRKLVGGLQP